MFHHPAWAVGSYSSGPPAGGTPKIYVNSSKVLDHQSPPEPACSNLLQLDTLAYCNLSISGSAAAVTAAAAQDVHRDAGVPGQHEERLLADGVAGEQQDHRHDHQRARAWQAQVRKVLARRGEQRDLHRREVQGNSWSHLVTSGHNLYYLVTSGTR